MQKLNLMIYLIDFMADLNLGIIIKLFNFELLLTNLGAYLINL